MSHIQCSQWAAGCRDSSRPDVLVWPGSRTSTEDKVHLVVHVVMLSLNHEFYRVFSLWVSLELVISPWAKSQTFSRKRSWTSLIGESLQFWHQLMGRNYLQIFNEFHLRFIRLGCRLRKEVSWFTWITQIMSNYKQLTLQRDCFTIIGREAECPVRQQKRTVRSLVLQLLVTTGAYLHAKLFNIPSYQILLPWIRIDTTSRESCLEVRYFI